jgi:SNF2 family DNA or RNA helicase
VSWRIENDFQNFHWGPLPLIADFESIFKISKRDPNAIRAKSEAKKMKVVITGNFATLHGPFPISFIATISLLSGKKTWLNSSTIKFEALTNNVKRLMSCGHDIEFVDETGTLADLADFENMPDQTAQIPVVHTNYKPKLPLRDYQQKAVNLSAERKVYGYFCQMGTGKSAICIANVGMLVFANKVTGALIISPRGVHIQWINEQFPEHADPSLNYEGVIWNGKVPRFNKKSQLQILSMNVDAIRTKNGFNAASEFLKNHEGKSIMIVDEAHALKNGSAQRTKAAWQLGKMATYRRVLTGTPVAKSIVDLWAQLKFLDERITQHKYFSSFRSEYAILGGFENRQIIGTKNEEKFYSLMAPHVFRMTKEEALDLPPKIYSTRLYEMSESTASHYNALKKNFLTQMDNGDIVDVQNAISCMLRLQQCLSGYLPLEDGSFETFSNDRLEILKDIIEQREGQVVIWCRFVEDINRIHAMLESEYGKGCSVKYYGGNVSERGESLRRFLAKDARFFTANPAAGGVGINIHGSGCETVIYYSNSFNFVERVQSEDRTHRLGTSVSVSYFDIVANKSIDKHILKSLKAKKSASDYSLDEIRKSLMQQ